MARRTLLLIASILTAALGTALIWLYVEGADKRAQQNADLRPALYLTADLKAGTSPTSAVTTKYVPPDAAAGAVATVAEVGNQKLKVPALKGQVLLQSMLGTSAADTGRFPEGGAVAVTISDPNRVPADLQPGDTVDVFELTKDGAQLVLPSVTVRTIGTETPAEGSASPAPADGAPSQNGAIPATIVGLNVGQRDAKRLYDAVARGGQVALYLHNP